jgi:molybdate transport system substrate-binding protein
MGWRRRIDIGRLCVSLLAALAVGISTMPVRAETVRVLAAGAAQGVVRRLEHAFASATGHTLDAIFDTVCALRDRVLAGGTADIVILSEAGIAALASAGKIDAGAAIELGTIAVALAVRKGAAVPDVSSSPEALKKTLRAAASIAHADPARGATAGAHFAAVLEQLGIAGELESRVRVLAFGGDVIDGVAQGRFAIGVSQSSEIAAHPGVVLAGGLPEPLARRTRYLAVKLPAAGPAAEAFLLLLGGPQGRGLSRTMGFDVP